MLEPAAASINQSEPLQGSRIERLCEGRLHNEGRLVPFSGFAIGCFRPRTPR